MSTKETENEQPKPRKARKKRAAAPIDEAVEKFEQPQSLPRGCDLAAVETDIRRYRCFEFEDAVYVTNDNTYRQVSNFTCAIHMHIVDENPTRLISIKNEDKQESTLHVPHDVFNAMTTFRKMVTGRGIYKWTGNEGDYMRYLWYMMDRMGSGRMILELGQQPEGFFVFCNKVINKGKVIALDKFGCFDAEGERYYVPAANTMNSNNDAEYGNARKVRFIESSVTFEALSRQQLLVHGDHAMLSQIHAIGTVLSDHIRERVEAYPIPFYYGPPGTGKDEVIKGGQRFYGIPQRPVRLPAGNTSPGIVNVFAELRCIPHYGTEWSSRLKDHMHEFCTGVYDGEGRRRGEKIAAGRSRYQTEDVPVRCTMSMSGNEYPNLLDQMLDRLIVSEMSKLSLTMEQRANFRVLKDMETEGYSHLLVEISKHREQFVAQWFSIHYQTASEMVKLSLDDRFVSERMRKSMCIMLSIRLFFEGKLKFAFTSDQFLTWLTTTMLKQQSRRVNGDEVSSFWSCFISGTNAQLLKRDKHFNLDTERGTIGFFWEDVFTVYMEQHRRIFNTPGKRDILNKLKQHESFIPGGVNKDVHAGYRIGRGDDLRKSSAYVFATERSGTDLVGLLSNACAMEETFPI